MSGMKRRIIALSILIIIFFIWWQPINLGATEVTIPKGVSAKEIAEFLARYQIVRDVHEFLFWLKISGKEKELKSGTYQLQRYRNPLYVINELSHGGKSDILVTIPEGLTLYETAEILEINGVINKEHFLALCNDQDFIREAGLKGNSLEGYLFPDTYSFNPSQSDSEIIMTFVDNFKKHLKKFSLEKVDSIYQIIILASMVEKEAKFEDERPIIAKVFLNRLRHNRPLESCATVFYALKKIDYDKYRTKTKLLDRDLRVNSPYNTYLHTGLPPAPICSPGEGSIKAVISPADVDYLYFVSMGNGRHHFSRTFREHIIAKEKYK
ncbi:MAG TPA: endolytic transglycosylase MltG [candidate division WOR-3 bacterium]|uniref:Endolytic murein transglycosylase n=1 Tax=candidate division WOR-3 bacterium TaxID=2052148 RepID=A0A9C9JZX2_UNCW3|nr:endolytic transglycosylase MltG [candidate division WOR-3 bacterium]